MSQTRLAFLWHHHQPFYKDTLAGIYIMPWVRLHAIKDYIGMALILREFPKLRVTINLVPSLIVQLEEYAQGKAEDTMLHVTRIPAGDLKAADRETLLRDGFMAHRETMIAPHARYAELCIKRRTDRPAREVVSRFTEQEMRDLQVWATLAWFHPLVVQAEPALQELVRKGRNFTEDDKAVMLQKQSEVIRRVLPLHRELMESGQIEISTTPFYHPILPLLARMEVATTHGHALPRKRVDLSEDAVTQVRKAVELYRATFGREPAGMWPAEGSVSEEILPIFRKFKITWIASDEEILRRSLDGSGAAKAIHYQPYLPPDGEAGPAIFFRDHQLSDAIGFEYQRALPRQAADDFVGRVVAAGKSAPWPNPMVSVILDGENAWEYYPNTGLDFLRSLYAKIEACPEIRAVTFSEHLAECPPRASLRRLFPGSWIDHNFAIWIGHPEDNLAWEHIASVRNDLVQMIGPPRADEPDPLKRQAWEQIYIAEGSDWFWWYGDDHSSAQDMEFDALFRRHLQAVYELLGRRPPYFLYRPIPRESAKTIHTSPTRFLRISLDGRVSHYFEWSGAGRYNIRHSAGSMRRATDPLIGELQFGFDEHNFFLRLDGTRRFNEAVPGDAIIRVRWAAPREMVLESSPLAGPKWSFTLREVGAQAQTTHDTMAVKEIVELMCPLSSLGAQPEQTMEFYVELARGEEVLERVPERGLISLLVPSPEFERIMWQV